MSDSTQYAIQVRGESSFRFNANVIKGVLDNALEPTVIERVEEVDGEGRAVIENESRVTVESAAIQTTT